MEKQMVEMVRAAAKNTEAKRENKAIQTQKISPSQSIISPIEKILFLQRTIGNQAVGRLIKSGALQTKLRIVQPGDIYEQEADRVADQVMRMTEPPVSKETKVSGLTVGTPVQRKCPGCKKGMKIEKEEEENLQKKEASGSIHEVTPELESSINAVRSGGELLPESARAFFEPRFGKDISKVRVHKGSYASETAKSINARAFTIGNNIAFGGGQFIPESHEGRRLLAHELTHVVQQTEHQGMPAVQRACPPSRANVFDFARSGTARLISTRLSHQITVWQGIHRIPRINPSGVIGVLASSIGHRLRTQNGSTNVVY